MGGLIEHPNRPASWYEFELLNRSGSRQGAEERAPSPALHLHFKVRAGKFMEGEMYGRGHHSGWDYVESYSV